MHRALSLLLILAVLPAGAALAEGDPPTEAEPNDGLSQAQVIPASGELAATVKSEKDQDWFEFTFEKAAFLRAKVSGVPGVDSQILILDEKRKPVFSLDGQGVGRGEEMVHRLGRGRYFLGVVFRPERGVAFSGTPGYTLSLAPTELLSYEPSMERIKAAIKRGLAYLAGIQEEEGAIPSKFSESGVTGLALMAFLGEGLPEFEENVERAAGTFKAAYLAPGTFPRSEHQEASLAGSLVGKASPHFMYEQAIAVLAMSEYVHHRRDEETRAMVEAGVDLLLRSQNSARKPATLRGPVPETDPNFGSWRYSPTDRGGDISVSGWCLIALAAAAEAGFEVPPEVRKDYMKFCRSCFGEELGAYTYLAGGTGAQTNTTNAVGVLTTLLCVGGECPVVRTGLREIRRNFPNWEVEGGRGKYPFYYWYYASRAMYVAGGDYWKEWQAAILPMLLEHQNEDGSWDAVLKEEPVGVPYTTSLAILILQLCSGNPPAYLKGLELKTETYPCPTCLSDIGKLLDAAERDDRSKEDLIKEIRKLIDRFNGE